MLGVDRRTIHRMAAAGRLPGQKMPGRTGAYVFDPATIEQLLEDAKAAGLQAAQLPLFTRKYKAARPRRTG